MTVYHPAPQERLRSRPQRQASSLTTLAARDILGGLAAWRLWSMLGWLDIRQRYRRSMLGAFWLTISMGVMVMALGTLYSSLFKVEINEFLPFIAAGLTIWGFLSTA